MLEPYVYLITEFLSHPVKGIGTRTSYWSDGKVVVEEFIMAAPILLTPINIC